MEIYQGLPGENEDFREDALVARPTTQATVHSGASVVFRAPLDGLVVKSGGFAVNESPLGGRVVVEEGGILELKGICAADFSGTKGLVAAHPSVTLSDGPLYFHLESAKGIPELVQLRSEPVEIGYRLFAMTDGSLSLDPDPSND